MPTTLPTTDSIPYSSMNLTGVPTYEPTYKPTPSSTTGEPVVEPISYSYSFSCDVGYWKAYCNGSHAYYVEGCEMCDENCVAMDMTIATSSQYYCDENDPYKAYYDVHGDGSEIQELEMFGTDPSMCKYDNCTGSYSFDYDDGKDKS